MDVVKKIEFLLDKKAKIEYLSMQPGDIIKLILIHHFYIDIVAIKVKHQLILDLKNLLIGITTITNNF